MQNMKTKTETKTETNTNYLKDLDVYLSMMVAKYFKNAEFHASRRTSKGDLFSNSTSSKDLSDLVHSKGFPR